LFDGRGEVIKEQHPEVETLLGRRAVGISSGVERYIDIMDISVKYVDISILI
jgi:hypothetical protein